MHSGNAQRAFVEKVRYCLANIRSDELRDEQMMFQWLFERFKNLRKVILIYSYSIVANLEKEVVFSIFAT